MPPPLGARDLFLAHRLWAIAIGKFFFEVNAAVSALAGSSRIPLGEFLLCDVASALLWAGTWAGIGYVLKDGAKEVAVALAPVGEWSLIVIAGALGAYVAVKCVKRSRDDTRGTTA